MFCLFNYSVYSFMILKQISIYFKILEYLEILNTYT